MTEPKERSRSTFEDLAKLAALPEPTTRLSDDEEENSGMIDLAAIAAGDQRGKKTPSVRPPSATGGSRPSSPPGPPERGQRLTDPIDTGAPPPVAVDAPLSAPMASLPAALIARMDAVSGITSPFPSASMLLRTTGAPAPSGRLTPPEALAGAVLDSRPVDSSPAVGPARPPSILPPAPAVPAGPFLPPIRTPMPSSSLLARTPLALETARPTALTPEGGKGGGGALVWLGVAGGMGLGAVLTAAFLHLHAAQSAQAAHVAAPAEGPTETAAPPDSAEKVEKEVTAQAPAPGPTARAPGLIATARPSPVAPHPAAAAGHAASTVSALAGTAQAASVEAPAESSPPASASPPAATEAASAAPTAESDPAEQSLEALMRKAVNGSTAHPPPLPTAAPAAAGAETAKAPVGNVPLKPSMGAVQGAVGAVLPAARYCLGPDDPVSHATLVFKSDGSVQSVAITGDASGQPAEACIRSRLLTTRVPPFANPTFTWTVTVRPASQ